MVRDCCGPNTKREPNPSSAELAVSTVTVRLSRKDPVASWGTYLSTKRNTLPFEVWTAHVPVRATPPAETDEYPVAKSVSAMPFFTMIWHGWDCPNAAGTEAEVIVTPYPPVAMAG